MSGVTILYASETGNAEEVAYEIASRVAALTGGAAAGAGVGGAGTGVGVGVGVSVGAQVMSVEEFDVLSLPELKKLVFVASTTGDGDPPDSMKTFWSFLLRRGLSATSLSGLGVGVFGLGDSSYEQFNAVARRLDRRLQQLGASCIVPLGLGDDQATYGYFTALDEWVPRLLLGLQSLPTTATFSAPAYPVPASPTPAPVPTSACYYEVTVLSTDNTDNDTDGCSAADIACLSRVGALVTHVVHNRRLTHSVWEQDVRHLRLQFGEHGKREPGNQLFQVGDVAEIFYRNAPEVVELALKILTGSGGSGVGGGGSGGGGGTGSGGGGGGGSSGGGGCGGGGGGGGGSLYAHSLLRITPTRTYTRRSRLGPVQCTLLTLLRCYLDIGSIPKRSYFAALAPFASQPLEAEKLLELASAEGTDLYFDYCIRERRNYCEVLAEFPSCRPPLSAWCALVPLIPPRQYSIASAPPTAPPPSSSSPSSSASAPSASSSCTSTSTPTSNSLDLCVAVAQRRTPYGRKRTGVCSGFIGQLQPGDRVFVRFKGGSIRGSPLCPPVGPTPPLILVGPGTGVAPMRALIQHHLQQQHQQQQHIQQQHIQQQHIHIAQTKTQTQMQTQTQTQIQAQTQAGLEVKAGLGSGQAQAQVGQQAAQTPAVLLFFGCRKRGRDFLFGGEWEALCGGRDPYTPPPLPPPQPQPQPQSEGDALPSASITWPPAPCTSTPPASAPTPSASTPSTSTFASTSASASASTSASASASASASTGSLGGSGLGVQVQVAFSQDQLIKHYVTHSIQDNGALVCRMLLQGGCVFVSGSAKRMPSDVRKAFSLALQAHAHMDAAESEAYLQQMARSRRYVVEAWS